jgi:hypothetical protein
MTPQQLLEQLGKMGIEAKVLRKIRLQIEEHHQNSKKPLQPEAILKYLVQKGAIRQADAEALLKTPSAQAPADTGHAVGDDLSDLIAGFDTAPPTQPETRPAPKPAADVAQSKSVAESKADEKKSSEKPRKLARKEMPGEAAIKPGKKTIANAETVYDPSLLAVSAEPVNSAPRNNPLDDFDSNTIAEPSRSLLPTFRGKKDKRNQWSTKWLYIATTLVGLLVIFGAVLALATMGLSADQKYQVAKDSFDRLAYLDAAKKFEDYYTAHPNHKNVPTAKALRVQALIRSHDQNGNHEEAIRTADNLLPPILDDPLGKIDELRDDLAVVLPRALFNVTEKAKKKFQIDELKKELERCERLKQVIDNVAYIPTSQRNKPTTADYLTRIDNNIKAIKTQIDKEEQYQQALIDIKQLGDALKTNEAFAVYRRLTRNFGDLAAREELRSVIQTVSLNEQQLVTPIEDPFNTTQNPRESAIHRTFVLARTNGETVESLKDESFCFLADGSVYAMRGFDGEILWRRFVGYPSDSQPQRIAKDQLLVSDQQEFDLLLLDHNTGDLIWRLEVGEPFMTPSINDAMIIVTTKAGKILRVDPNDGKVLRAVKLPQPATVPALVTDREPYIYQVGAHSNLYVISKEDLSCREVVYLGHERGAIAVAPVYWSGLIALAVNRGTSCDLWAFRSDGTGLELELIQVLNVFRDGIVKYPIQRYGSWVMLTNTRGELQILEHLTQEEVQRAPVARFASELFENSGANTHVLTEGNNIWIAGLELSRIKLQRAQSKLTRETISNAGDHFLTPMQRVDDYLFHVRRRKGSGMISASLVDAIKLEQIWRVDFGGVVPGAPVPGEDGFSIVSNQGDLFHIKDSDKASVSPVAIGSRTVESLKFQYIAPLGQSELAAIGVSGQREMLYGKNDQGQLLGLAPPAEKVACQPLVLGGNLIVPSSDGPVVRINPTTGQMIGTPFMPPISAGKKTVWFEPSMLFNNRFVIANGANGASDASESKLYLISAENPSSLTEVNSLRAPLPFKSQLANNGTTVFAVVEGTDADQMLAIGAESLEVQQQVALPGRIVDGPWIVGNGVLVKMDNDQLMMIDMSLAPRWQLSIANDRLAGVPESLGTQILVGFQNGRLLLVEPSDGKIAAEFFLRQPIASMPVQIGSRLYCSGMDGTVHEIDLTSQTGANR